MRGAPSVRPSVRLPARTFPRLRANHPSFRVSAASSQGLSDIRVVLSLLDTMIFRCFALDSSRTTKATGIITAAATITTYSSIPCVSSNCVCHGVDYDSDDNSILAIKKLENGKITQFRRLSRWLLPGLCLQEHAGCRTEHVVRPSVSQSVSPYPHYLCGPPRGPWAWLSGLLAELDALIGLPQASHHLSAMRPSSRDSYFYHRECKNPRCGYHQSYFKHSPKSLHCESLSLIGAKALSGCVCMKSDRQMFVSLHIDRPSSLAS